MNTLGFSMAYVADASFVKPKPMTPAGKRPALLWDAFDVTKPPTPKIDRTAPTKKAVEKDDWADWSGFETPSGSIPSSPSMVRGGDDWNAWKPSSPLSKRVSTAKTAVIKGSAPLTSSATATSSSSSSSKSKSRAALTATMSAAPSAGKSVSLDEQLRAAIIGDKLSLARTLLEAGASPDIIEESTKLPMLHWAINKKNHGLMKFLLDSGADPNSPTASLKFTALHRAVNLNDVAAIKILLDAGCDVAPVDMNGRTPYTIAGVKSFSEAGIILRAKMAERSTLVKGVSGKKESSSSAAI